MPIQQITKNSNLVDYKYFVAIHSGRDLYFLQYKQDRGWIFLDFDNGLFGVNGHFPTEQEAILEVLEIPSITIYGFESIRSMINSLQITSGGMFIK